MKPFWNIVSLALPVAVAVLGAIVAVSSRSGTGGYAGRIGSGVLLILAIGGACVFGEAAAIASLVRGERHAWLGVLGLVLNFAVILPIASALMSD